MAGEINFGLLQTPDFVGNALAGYEAGQRQRSMRAKRNALAMYGTDPQGAINALRTEDPEAAFSLEDRRQKLDDRSTRIKGARALASGDYEGAKQAYADVGDASGVSDADDLHEKNVKRVAGEAQFLLGVLKQQGPDAALAAYDQRSATYGNNPQQIAQIRDAIAKNPEQTLTNLAGAAEYKYQRGGDGSIVAINQATGEAKEVYKGSKPAPSGYRYDDEGGLEYIPGGPADPSIIGNIAGVRRDAVVKRPMPKTGGGRASIPPPPGGWKPVGQ